MVSDFRKGRYNLMKIYVGIDIAKLNHFAAAISSDGEIIIEPFKFTNDADGFQLLVSKLESFDKNSLIIGLESTAHYGDNLVRYLVTELYQVCVLNPIKTCQMRKNNVRKTKTDKVDTYVIAKTLMIQDNLRFVSFFDLDMMDLKALGRFRQKTIKQRTRLKIQLTTYVDQVFPEIQYFFKSGLHQHAVYALLKEAPLLILDDATSALDYLTEAKLLQAIKDNFKKTTLIMVSQRTNSLSKADNILVLDQGKQVALADHAKLLQTCSLYQEIHYSQHPQEEVVK